MAELIPGLNEGTPGSLDRMERRARERAEVLVELNALSNLARSRMPPQGSELYPTESDWMSPEELKRLQELHLRLMELGDSQEEIRARVEAKRAARRKAMGLE